MENTVSTGLKTVETVIKANLNESLLSKLGEGDIKEFYRGKFLRSRFGLHLLAGAGIEFSEDMAHCFAGVELIHSASLIHDDMIDNAEVRRGLPSWWRRLGPSSAVIMGDYLFCVALTILSKVKERGMQEVFTGKIKEMCEGEFEQACLYRGKEIPLEECSRINRQKTGALFAAIGAVAGNGSEELKPVFEESGYTFGTAYQLLDDLLDEFGEEDHIGKTLGTDKRDNKPTPVRLFDGRTDELYDRLENMLAEPEQMLAAWPAISQSYHAYTESAIRPFLQRLADNLEARERLQTRNAV
ncbi:polyprenyl synthetase family protein [Planctomycetota bacterium]